MLTGETIVVLYDWNEETVGICEVFTSPVTQLVTPAAQLVTVELDVEYIVLVTQTMTTSVVGSGAEVVNVRVGGVLSTGGVSLTTGDTIVVEVIALLVTEATKEVEVDPTEQ